MTYTTLITTAELAEHLQDPNWVIVDCRFSLDNPERGRLDYEKAHILGAVYAHLDESLSGPVVPGVTGRHPLPDPEKTAGFFKSWGIGAGVQVVAYDDASGALAAARMWWLLRWMGHEQVAVLDGGWPHWEEEGCPVRGGEETPVQCSFVLNLRPDIVADAALVEAVRQDPAWRVIDVRAAERYHGEKEPIDRVAGHIPGAYNAPYAGNLYRRGLFAAPEKLRGRYTAILGDTPSERVIFYCGSGVTAAHGVLAMMHAGLGEARLYAGSWSEWITDPDRPVDKSPRSTQA